MNCIQCQVYLPKNVHDYSVNSFGVPLCRSDQDWVRQMEGQTTYETLRLYFALKQRGVPAELEKFDGFKTIDIAIPEAKVNIEVDGSHHNTSAKQAMSDLKRTYYSFMKGYMTFRIPNQLTRNDDILEETADFLVDILKASRDRKGFW
ncbi:DUF559 domain-containing protein [Ekhidna sp.]|uniref:DUF559 domain-containing protein n=1 Tax=Ekhidna sp. TaxID=2608089 RepID=UPI0035142ED1